MSESPETANTPAAPPATPEPKPYWVYRLAAWVAIIAGIVFIVSTIFVAGAWTSRGGSGDHHCHRGHHGHHGATFHHKGPHHRGPGPMAPVGPDGEGPGDLPPKVTQPPGR